MANDTIRPRHARHGVALVYVTMTMVVLVGFVSLAIDVGHVWLVHTELQHAADAAVRYGLAGLATSPATAQSNAVAAAADNTADGSPVVLNPATDIDFGTWNASSQTFTVLTGAARSGANAMRVRAVRTAANNNAVACFFGAVVGHGSADVHASASGSAKAGYALVGLSWVTLSGNNLTAYWSSTGAASTWGTVASNGNITLSGGAMIQGNALPGPGMSVITNGGASVTGSTTPLAAPLSYPNASAGSAATSNNDALAGSSWNSGTNDLSIGGGTLTLPGGVYYFNNFTTSGSGTLSFSGPATVYVTGKVALSGTILTAANLPKNLSLQVIGSGTVTLSGGGMLYGTVYAPQSDVTISGNGTFYGSIVGDTITGSGASSINYDLSLPGAWNISMVQ